ncbi:MAG: polysaccharide biosynthesis C-terminal domain-containing protein [Oscillospiraceae bacterium]
MGNRYEKLLGNTLIFAIGSFSSKALVLLMMSFYTRTLTDMQFGAAELITTTSNLLTPFVMLSINEAIIRFGMDRTVKKTEVLSIGLSVVLMGFAVFCLFCPLMLQFEMISSYTLLIYLYVLAAALKSVVAQFVRSSGAVRLYAFDGFISTATTILFNILFLAICHLGMIGYVLSIILSNVLSVIFLFFTARLPRLVNLWHINKPLRREMLRYAIPLIPTTMFWWITTACDRYIIIYYYGEAANGLYSAAHKLPAVLTLVSAVFYQAWQISAISESGQGNRSRHFYSQVYDYYTTLLFVAASGIIMLCRPVISIWLGEAFRASWEYVPFLTIAEVISTLVTFLGSFYMVSKRNATVPLAIAVGAVANLVLNFLFVPDYGAKGAALATVFSYMLAFVVRAFDVRRFVDIDLRPLPSALSLLILMMQAWLLLNPNVAHPFWAQIMMFAVMLLFNLRPLLRLCFALLDRFAKPCRRT